MAKSSTVEHPAELAALLSKSAHVQAYHARRDAKFLLNLAASYLEQGETDTAARLGRIAGFLNAYAQDRKRRAR